MVQVYVVPGAGIEAVQVAVQSMHWSSTSSKVIVCTFLQLATNLGVGLPLQAVSAMVLFVDEAAKQSVVAA